MRRSEINNIITNALEFIDQMNFKLPPFAYWTAENFKSLGHEHQEIIDNMLGWDVTDFGSGNFEKIGLLIFVLRNGNFYDKKYIKPYCEKILIVDEGQVLPSHFHWKKIEDIINRGGGNLLIELYGSTPDEQYSKESIEISMDGKKIVVNAGDIVKLKPGESITLLPGQYHKFWAEKGTGKILLGEVSTVSDDRIDNRFYNVTDRLPEIEEDEAAMYLLFKDYPDLK